MIFKKNKCIIISLITVASVFVIFLFIPNTNLIEDKKQIETVVETFLQNYKKNSYYTNDATKLFCVADVAWSYELNENEQIVIAKNLCKNILMKNNTICEISGGYELPLFKLSKNSQTFEVIDHDSRFNFFQKPNKDWLIVVENKIPDSLKVCLGRGCRLDDKVFLQKLSERNEKFTKLKKLKPCDKNDL